MFPEDPIARLITYIAFMIMAIANIITVVVNLNKKYDNITNKKLREDLDFFETGHGTFVKSIADNRQLIIFQRGKMYSIYLKTRGLEIFLRNTDLVHDVKELKRLLE